MGSCGAVASPPDTEAGGRWRGHRQIIDAIAQDGTGTSWMDLPEHFGSWEGVDDRLRTWAAGGICQRILTARLAQADT
ncbi:transposase [Streptomyces sp. NPDC026673]|uniref:transposase n=1 Tax=Streptomyces sp. NPDC026673 TaxID=3155724 RepID=UPI0033C0F5A0